MASLRYDVDDTFAVIACKYCFEILSINFNKEVRTLSRPFVRHHLHGHKTTSFALQTAVIIKHGDLQRLACEVDAADGVDMIMHVRRVAAALAAVLARKLWPRACQPDAEPIPVVQPWLSVSLQVACDT